MRSEKKYSMSRINGSLAAVRFHCMIQLIDLDVWTDPVVSAARKAASREVGVESIRKTSVNFKYPLPLDLLLAARSMYMEGSLETRMTYIGCCLGYHMMMRVSEFAVTKSAHFITGQDVEFVVPGQHEYVASVDAKRYSQSVACLGVLITIWSSKTNQERRGYTHALRGEHEAPELERVLVDDMWQFARQSGALKTDPFFRRYENGRGKSLRSKEVAQMIKDIMQRAGENPQRFSTRSLRSGGATTLSSKGVDDATTNKLGRWSHTSVSAPIYRRSVAVVGGALSSDTVHGAVALGSGPFSSKDLSSMRR